MDRLAAAPWTTKAKILCMMALGFGLGASALALLIALLGLGRLSDGFQSADLAWLWTYRDREQVKTWLQLGALVSVGFGVLVIGLVARGRQASLHGDARWARGPEITKAGLRGRDGVILGRHGGRLLSLAGQDHVLLAAPTRSGKGVGVVIPNLLAWRGSAVVLDIKRENWAATAGFRAAHGQSVWLFDPLEPEGRTARFNPLGMIDRDDPVAVIDELQRIASMLFPAPEGADPFWAEAARTGFVGVGAMVAATPERPLHLGEVFRELTCGDPRERLPAELKARRTAGAAISQACESAIFDFCAASENTFASVRQTLTSRMGLWLNPRVVAATAESDFDLRDLRTFPMSIYLAAAPENLVRLAPLYSLFFQQLIDATTRQGLADPKVHLPVLVLLDEFARLGAAKMLAQAFSYAAGYGLRLLPVLQSHAQLRALYGADGAAEITANCGAEVAFAPRTYAEAEALSQRLGYRGMVARSKSRPAGFSSGRRSMSESLQRRALMLPQELLGLPEDELIVLRGGIPPVRGRKIRYFRDAAFRDRVRPPPQVPPLARPVGDDQAAPAGGAPRSQRPSLDPETVDLDVALQILRAAGEWPEAADGPGPATASGPAAHGLARSDRKVSR